MKFTWDMNPVIIQFNEVFGLRYYGLIFSLVFIGAFFLFRWQVRRGGGNDDDVYGMVFPAALGVVIGARLGHVLFYNLDYALQHPLWVFQIWTGGLSSHGAFAGLLIAGIYYVIRHHQSFLECFDRFSFCGALAAILIRLGNFFNSEIVGRVTDQTWGVKFPRYDQLPLAEVPYRYPSQLFEAFLGLVLMGTLLFLDRRFDGEKRPRGLLTAAFMIVYFSGRFIIEFFKEYDGISPDSPLTMGQILSMPCILGGLGILYYVYKCRVPAHWNVAPQPPALEKSAKTDDKRKSGGARKRKKQLDRTSRSGAAHEKPSSAQFGGFF